MLKNTLSKEERLCSKRSIDGLFAKGSSFVLYPFRFVVLQSHDEQPAKILFSVSKRKFRKAVDRNLIKRRMREAYRLNKNAVLLPALKEGDLSLHIAIQYLGKTAEPFELMSSRMGASLKKIADAGV